MVWVVRTQLQKSLQEFVRLSCTFMVSLGGQLKCATKSWIWPHISRKHRACVKVLSCSQNREFSLQPGSQVLGNLKEVLVISEVKLLWNGSNLSLTFWGKEIQYYSYWKVYESCQDSAKVWVVLLRSLVSQRQSWSKPDISEGKECLFA